MIHSSTTSKLHTENPAGWLTWVLKAVNLTSNTTVLFSKHTPFPLHLPLSTLSEGKGAWITEHHLWSRHMLHVVCVLTLTWNM